MKQPLTAEDIRSLEYECRTGRIIAIIINSLGGILIIYTIAVAGSILNALLFLLFSVLLSVLISYLMNHKYKQDIKQGEKDIVVKAISLKEQKVGYEAGSGSMSPTQKMKSFDVYRIIIEDYRYDVDKDFFESCNEGDEVMFHIAPLSEHRLKMELVNKI